MEAGDDGKNMIVTVRDGPQIKCNPLNVMFEVLEGDEWYRVRSHIDDLGHQVHSVALSSQTVFVGLPSTNNKAGGVLLFEKHQFGGVEEDGGSLCSWFCHIA